MDKITRDGDPLLRQVSTAVPFPLSEEHAQLAQDMMTYLVVSGLAAPDMLVEIEGEAVGEITGWQATQRIGLARRRRWGRDR